MWMDDFETEAWPWQDEVSRSRPALNLTGRRNAECPMVFSTPYRGRRDGPARDRFSGGLLEVSLSRTQTARSFFLKTHKIKKWAQPLSHRGVVLHCDPRACRHSGRPVLEGCCDRGSGRSILPAWQWSSVPPRSICCFTAGIIPSAGGDRFMGSLWIPAVLLGCLLCRWGLDISPCLKAPTVYLLIHGLILISLVIQGVNLVFLFEKGIHLTTQN